MARKKDLGECGRCRWHVHVCICGGLERCRYMNTWRDQPWLDPLPAEKWCLHWEAEPRKEAE